MEVGINPKLANEIYSKISEPVKEKDGEFGDLVKNMLDNAREQSKDTEANAMLQSKNSISSGDFSKVALDIKSLDMNAKLITSIRDSLVKTVNQIQQMPM